MRDICLIDGGLGQEIYRRSGRAADPLWSVKVMQDQPELVEAVHRDFIEAGAQILTLNTYASTSTTQRQRPALRSVCERVYLRRSAETGRDGRRFEDAPRFWAPGLRRLGHAMGRSGGEFDWRLLRGGSRAHSCAPGTLWSSGWGGKQSHLTPKRILGV